jgi:hypothetical protein
MSRFRKTLLFFSTCVLAAFALPAAAVDKLFDLTMSSISPTASCISDFSAGLVSTTLTPGTYRLCVKWTNSPSNSGGNSVINSGKVELPAVATVNSWTTVNPGASAVIGGGTLTQAGGVISLSNITGAKPGGYIVLDLNIDVPAADCGRVYKGYAWTGNTFGGTQFVASPTGADIEKAFTCGLGCNLDTNAWTLDAGFAGNPLLDPEASTDPASPGATRWGLRRYNDANGSCSSSVSFTFFYDGVKESRFSATSPTGTKMVVEYVVVGAPMPVDSNNTSWTSGTSTLTTTAGFNLPKQPRVAWALKSDGTPDYVPALFCRKDAPADGLRALPLIPNVAPFNTYPSAHPYYPGNTAYMCLGGMGVAAVGPDDTGTEPAASTNIQYYYRIIDASDGYFSQN